MSSDPFVGSDTIYSPDIRVPRHLAGHQPLEPARRLDDERAVAVDVARTTLPIAGGVSPGAPARRRGRTGRASRHARADRVDVAPTRDRRAELRQSRRGSRRRVAPRSTARPSSTSSDVASQRGSPGYATCRTFTPMPMTRRRSRPSRWAASHSTPPSFPPRPADDDVVRPLELDGQPGHSGDGARQRRRPRRASSAGRSARVPAAGRSTER